MKRRGFLKLLSALPFVAEWAWPVEPVTVAKGGGIYLPYSRPTIPDYEVGYLKDKDSDRAMMMSKVSGEWVLEVETISFYGHPGTAPWFERLREKRRAERSR